MAEGEITTFTALTERFNLPPGNYKKPKLLYCSNGGHFLRILPDGTVDGTRDRSDQHKQLLDTPDWCLTPNEECLFLERLEENHYNTYTSKKHAEKNWFVGLKKNGSCKRGPRTHYGQKAILFLPLPFGTKGPNCFYGANWLVSLGLGLDIQLPQGTCCKLDLTTQRWGHVQQQGMEEGTAWVGGGGIKQMQGPGGQDVGSQSPPGALEANCE
ncbi:hypothetical protein A6R68_06053 [Neotoma lepida]|uniref:Uncharacterized protein n=1 Tax=Neotoma lepida TaxID=56216 RepID=A0A1A6GI04_NEOLE|nr:hypothetical protein A6R68_06053 [Neotoma lepida]